MDGHLHTSEQMVASWVVGADARAVGSLKGELMFARPRGGKVAGAGRTAPRPLRHSDTLWIPRMVLLGQYSLDWEPCWASSCWVCGLRDATGGARFPGVDL